MQTNGKHFESSINLRRTHIKILQFFLLKNFHTCDIGIPSNSVEYINFGGVTTFAVKVWSWKLCQIKDPLALEL